MTHLSTKKTLWNRPKISGLFPCYVFLAKSWNVVSVLNFTIMLNSLSVFSSMYFFFCEIAPAPRSCSLFLTPSVKAWTKILKQMLSIWTLLKPSIPLITQVLLQKVQTIRCERRHARLVCRLPQRKIAKGPVGWCCFAMGPRYIGSSLGGPTRPSSI